MMIKKAVKCVVSKLGYFLPVKSKMNVVEAKEIFQAYSPKPSGCCFAANKVDLKYDLHIIIAAYNCGKYIGECLRSVLNQKTKYSVLVTVVNDGSTDNTAEIIDDIVGKFSGDIATEVISQENKGQSAARNVAFKLIKGKYITFIDADDVLTELAIDKMMDAALSSDADILQGSWYDFDGDRRVDRITETPNSIYGFACGKLYRYNVLEHFRFLEGYWFEDTPISFILAATPIKIVAIKDIVYGYRKNPNGITSTSVNSKKSLDSYWITEQCLEEFPKFDLKYDQRAYEYLLRQTLMNNGRTRFQPRIINEAQFILTADLLDRYFKGFRTEQPRMKKIENALRKRQYIKFKILLIGM